MEVEDWIISTTIGGITITGMIADTRDGILTVVIIPTRDTAGKHQEF